MRIRDAVDDLRQAQQRQQAELDEVKNEVGSGDSGSGTDQLSQQFSRFSVVETSQMDFANDVGAVTVQPGESKPIVEWRASGESQEIMALGATDRPYSEYALKSDDQIKFRTYSPLGLVNNPFSFKQELGFTYPAGRTVTYEVTLSDQATEPKDYVARLFVGER